MEKDRLESDKLSIEKINKKEQLVPITQRVLFVPFIFKNYSYELTNPLQNKFPHML